MVTAEVLVDLARRFVLRDGETIEWMKAFPDGPAVDLETPDRAFAIQVVRGELRVEQEAWIEAVVAVSREDQDVEGPSPRELFLVTGDGATIRLRDAAAVAELGRRVQAGSLHPMAYAEMLIESQWPGGWSKQIVVDPVGWRAGYPAEAPVPQVRGLSMRQQDARLHLSFAASRERAEAAGGRAVLDVSAWTVSVPLDAPATWERHAVAEAVPLLPPW